MIHIKIDTKNTYPITQEAFFQACIYFPVFFKKDKTNYHAVALLGLEEKENLFEKEFQSICMKQDTQELYEKGVQSMHNIIQYLDNLGILIQKNISLMDGKYTFNDFYKVDEEKFLNLDDKILLELIDTDIYKLATMQILSYYNLDKLIALKKAKG